MLLHKSTKAPRNERRTGAPRSDRWLLADLEAAQRRDIYAAGQGDGRQRSSFGRWTVGRSKRS